MPTLLLWCVAFGLFELHLGISFLYAGFKFASNIITILQLLKVRSEEVLIESTGVIGQRIKKVDISTLCPISYVNCVRRHHAFLKIYSFLLYFSNQTFYLI